jgi:hypothetical protein
MDISTREMEDVLEKIKQMELSDKVKLKEFLFEHLGISNMDVINENKVISTSQKLEKSDDE